MFLSSLTLKGFKSFADTTALRLEPGVTTVVGPNGSGKSNIVDAIAWVLGAQGPSALRSQKMDDVVFAGTENRPALGRAEVTLVIDNAQDELPVETAEVAITRRLYRSGDSEYLLNGTQCRLADLQELLSDAGVGRQQHIIVAQGQIEQVLSARPEERRAIVEDAAGILKFRRRKERAERRLAATQENVARLSDLQRELKRQLKPLQRQSEGAKRHEQLSQEFEALRLYDAGQRLAGLQSEQQRLVGLQSDLATDIAAKRALLDELREAITAAEDEQSAIVMPSPTPPGTRAADTAAAGTGTAGTRAPSTRTASEASGGVAPDSLARVMALSERSRGLLGQVYERLRATERDKGAALAQDVVANYYEEKSRISQELSALETQQKSIAHELELVADQKASPISANPTSANAGQTDPSPEPTEKTLAAAVQTATDNLTTAEQSLADQAESFRGIGEELQRWTGRADALRLALDQARQSSGIAALQDADGVIGVLTDLINVQPGAERSIKAAIGESLTAVVVKTQAQAQAALQALSEHAQPASPGQPSSTPASPASSTPASSGQQDPGQQNTVTVLALPQASHPPTHPSELTEAGFTPLRSCVSAADPAHEELLAPLLDALLTGAFRTEGDWRNAIKGAMAHPTLTFVTERGDRCGPNGWRIGASTDAVTSAALADAEKNIAQLQTALTAADQARTNAQSQRSESATALSGAQASLQQAIQAAAAAQADRARRLSEQEATLAERAKALNQRQTELARRDHDITARLAGHEQAMADAGNLQDRLNRLTHGLNKLVGLLATTRQRLDVTAGLLRQRDAARQVLMQRLRERLDTHRSQHAFTETELAQLEATRARHDVDASALSTELEILQTSLIEELETDAATVLAAPPPALEPGVSAKQRLKQVRDELKRLGPVNPLALSEFEAITERHEFVAGQLEDVRQSRRELGKVVKHIEAEMEVMFAAAFDDVKQTFERLFETLFPGGSGTLSLTDDADALANGQATSGPTSGSPASGGPAARPTATPTSAGIDLNVRPSGKKVSRLSLLSGGERSLTALAFLFSVFRSRPSPFYILDEVEASLDDVNLSRFLNLVAEFRNEVQLIIVTHQQRTMEFADVMYGVSMPPGGSSAVIAERTKQAQPTTSASR